MANQSVDNWNLDYFYVLLCVLFLGSATVFTQGSLENFGFSISMSWESIAGKLLMLILSLIILYRHQVNIIKCFDTTIFVVLLIWGILQYIKYEQFSTYPLVRLMNVFFALVLIRCYRKKLIYYLEDIISKLSLIGVLMWFVILIAPNVIDYLMSLSPVKGYGLVDGNSWIVFAQGHQYEIVRRNLGFAWEPGRFGSILVLASFFNLIIHRFEIKNNLNFLWLSLGIISTQSTTAYVGYIVVLMIYLYNKKTKYFLVLTPLIVLLSILLMGLPFMGNKIVELSIFNKTHVQEWSNAIDWYSTQDRYVVPQRFDALLLEGMNILHDPFLGNATDTYSYLYGIFGIKFSLSNGVLRIFANMGILIGILYYILSYKSSIWMRKVYKYKGQWAFFVVLFTLNVSYSWIFEPIFLYYILYPYIIKEKSIAIHEWYRIIFKKKLLALVSYGKKHDISYNGML